MMKIAQKRVLFVLSVQASRSKRSGGHTNQAMYPATLDRGKKLVPITVKTHYTALADNRRVESHCQLRRMSGTPSALHKNRLHLPLV